VLLLSLQGRVMAANGSQLHRPQFGSTECATIIDNATMEQQLKPRSQLTRSVLGSATLEQWANPASYLHFLAKDMLVAMLVDPYLDSMGPPTATLPFLNDASFAAIRPQVSPALLSWLSQRRVTPPVREPLLCDPDGQPLRVYQNPHCGYETFDTHRPTYWQHGRPEDVSHEISSCGQVAEALGYIDKDSLEWRYSLLVCNGLLPDDAAACQQYYCAIPVILCPVSADTWCLVHDSMRTVHSRHGYPDYGAHLVSRKHLFRYVRLHDGKLTYYDRTVEIPEISKEYSEWSLARDPRELAVKIHFLSCTDIVCMWKLGSVSVAVARIRWTDGQLAEFVWEHSEYMHTVLSSQVIQSSGYSSARQLLLYLIHSGSNRRYLKLVNIDDGQELFEQELYADSPQKFSKSNREDRLVVSPAGRIYIWHSEGCIDMAHMDEQGKIQVYGSAPNERVATTAAAATMLVDEW
jgi:hypothetical protein